MSLNEIESKRNYSLKYYTTIRIGGAADYFFIPKNKNQLRKVIEKVGEDFYLLGRGSNLLLKDEPIGKSVIKLDGSFKYVRVDADLIEVGGATPLSYFLNYCIKNNLGGLENLAGIPASLGGILATGASSFGSNFFSFLKKVEVVDRKGKISKLEEGEVNFGYRESSLKGKIIMRAWFKLSKDDFLKKRIKNFLAQRIATQDFDFPSCGCIFKNPLKANPVDSSLTSAGALIESCGFKGMKKNDACISLKHANFIVNLGRARYNDVDYLINRIKDKIYSKYNIVLEEEIERWI